VLQAAKLLSCEPAPTDGWIIQLTTNHYSAAVSARSVIDATGRHASLVRRLGGTRIACDQLVGIYGYYVLKDESAATDNFMLIEACEHGWWYSVPLPENRLAVTFMTDADLSPRAIMHDVSHWHEQLLRAKHTAARTTAFKLAGPLKLRSANNSRSNPIIGPGWLSVGDAAVAYDPLSGDGVLRALDTGKRGANAAMAALNGDQSQAYEYSRELLAEFELYLRRQISFYSRECRWPTAPFWSRRR
jgi:flavin-dependent dehydrogenase